MIHPTTKHIPLARPIDVDMSDADPQPTAAPDPPVNLDARLEEMEKYMYENAQWLEGLARDCLGPMREMWDRLESLGTRMDNMEAYLGLGDSTQLIALYNGRATIIYQTMGGPSWRRHMGLAERMEAVEDVAGGPSRLGMAEEWEADDDPPRQNGEWHMDSIWHN
jgi:hypothetical protein